MSAGVSGKGVDKARKCRKSIVEGIQVTSERKGSELE